MLKSRSIQIESPRILKDRILVSKISFSKDLKRYFQSDLFYTKYDVNIHKISESILQIPVVSNIMPVAWAIGADVYLKELDTSYIESLKKMKQLMRRNYPQFSFSSTLHVEKSVNNTFANQGYGLFFSGGLDSTAALIRNRKKNPHLMLIFGADIALANKQKQRITKRIYTKFAKAQTLNLSFIESNFRGVINEAYLNALYTNVLYYYWYLDIAYGIGVVGLSAPLTVAKSIGTLLFATGAPPSYKLVIGEQYLETPTSWGDIQVSLDGTQLSRQEKIGSVLKPYIKSTTQHPLLRVCFSQKFPLNCNQCEKCWRTIIGLVLENIDPNKCGFHINNDFFPSLKKRLIKGKNQILHIDADIPLWEELKKAIPPKITHDLYHSKEFLEWFRTFDLPPKRRHFASPFTQSIRLLYCYLPKSGRTLIDRLHPFF